MDYKKLDLPNTNYPNKEQLEDFKTAFDAFLETNQQENENHHNDAFNDLLKGVFKYKVKPTKKIDSAILNDNNEVEVIIEFKALKNPNEFIKKGDLNVKALHESLLYYLTERKEGNNNLKHLILATIKELYIIDANEFEVFNKDKEIKKAFENCHDKKGNDPRTKAFYDACQKRLNELDHSLKYHHIPLKKENLALIYQALSPNFLLKIPKYSDANTLNKDFYEELLYILGLEEQKEQKGGKILIKPSDTKNSLSYALKEQYNNLDDEIVMALLIAWNNRILFLRLLESLLISFKHFEKPFLTTENFKDFNALNTLFFEVLAKKNSERSQDIKEHKIFGKIPYLNSSLFDKTPLELNGYEIKLLNNKPLEIYPKSILKKDENYQKQKDLPLLEYLFAFLRLYKFTTTPEDIKNNTDTSESRLINPSVLGLVFEKLNGYKEGSFYTPSFITSYMCKESITKKIVLDKFNAIYQWDCKDLEALREKIDRNFSNEKAKEYLNTLLTLRICDPAVGSGHFLVSALNEMVWVAYDLGLIVSLYRYELKLENDEIIIHHKLTGEVFKYTMPHRENDPHHQIQKELFNLKKDIIENCLFGVDINPNSCEITKLRLWIELLKYSYYIFEEGKNTHDLETLPNIDINIKCGNSLISRFNLNDDLKKISNIKKKIQEYKDLVAQYKDPNPLYSLNKTDLINKIQELKNTFSLTLKDPKTKAELEKAIEKHIKNYNDFALDDKSLLDGLNYFIPSLFGTPKLSPKEEEEAFASYGRIRALRKKLDDALSGGEYQNAFEWRFEFPEVLDDEGNFLGFDCIIGNPPYMQVKKGLYSSIFYPFSEAKDVGKQNTYKVFIELGFNLVRQKGLISLITQSSIMCDKSAQFTRELLLKYCQMHYFVEFNKKQKLFSNVIQGVCILEFLKNEPHKEHAFKIAINNTQTQMNQIQYKQIKQDEILKFFPLYEIPLIKSGEMEIVRKIKTDKILFRDLLEKSLQGNINTIHLKDIQDEKETNGRIYKGANCHRYFLDTQYLFAKDNQITQQIFEKNYYQNIIVTQNITGTSDAYRIHANLIEVKNQKMLFLDTCNLSYCKCKEREHAKFLVGLLNSRLFDWLFRKTSTNNHVNLYELETLPIPKITTKNQELAQKITDCAERILKAKEKDPKANTQELEQKIDALVYQLYNLTDEEVKIIENGQ
ncbi:Eco57I restriction-modification methylase domain-containing protein [Helicobacter pylori]|nr:Eco57I restriction-modification methylase domain-containing protein [Helicobacter pylori]